MIGVFPFLVGVFRFMLLLEYLNFDVDVEVFWLFFGSTTELFLACLSWGPATAPCDCVFMGVRFESPPVT
jgi:hypothetical protein